MSESTNKLVKWQERFFAQPCVFFTEEKDHDGQMIVWEVTGNFYATREAAEIEVAWAKKQGKHQRVQSGHLHDLALSEERWNR